MKEARPTSTGARRLVSRAFKVEPNVVCSVPPQRLAPRSVKRAAMTRRDAGRRRRGGDGGGGRTMKEFS